MSRSALAAWGFVGLVACGGGDSGSGVGAGGDPTTTAPVGTTPGASTSAPPGSPPPDLPAPTAVDKTLEYVPGTTVIGSLEAAGATDVTFEIVTPPAKGAINWIDATKGELVYRPATLTSADSDELTYVAKRGGKVSAPAKVLIKSKALDFSAGMVVKAPKESWYSYNLAANFNNGGSNNCGAEQPLSIVGGKLLERAWGACGTYPEIAVTVGAGSVRGSTSSAGGSFRRVTIARKQFDAFLAYREESTACSSYNSTLNSCNAGKSEDTTGRIVLGTPPATTSPPSIRSTTCETTGTTICDGIFAATDPDGDELSFEMTQPANGSAGPNQDMKGYAYKAKAGFAGTDTFTVVVSDGTTKTAPTTITVIVK